MDGFITGAVFYCVSAGVKAIANVVNSAKSVQSDVIQAKIDKIAIKYSHNKGSDKVMLGKFDDGGSTSYIQLAKDTGSTYFAMPTKVWNKLALKYGDDMWKINEAFLNQQISAGKMFLSSHNALTATNYFFEEITYLANFKIIPINIFLL